jgi:hypothetical protein
VYGQSKDTNPVYLLLECISGFGYRGVTRTNLEKELRRIVQRHASAYARGGERERVLRVACCVALHLDWLLSKCSDLDLIGPAR